MQFPKSFELEFHDQHPSFLTCQQEDLCWDGVGPLLQCHLLTHIFLSCHTDVYSLSTARYFSAFGRGVPSLLSPYIFSGIPLGNLSSRATLDSVRWGLSSHTASLFPSWWPLSGTFWVCLLGSMAQICVPASGGHTGLPYGRCVDRYPPGAHTELRLLQDMSRF